MCVVASASVLHTSNFVSAKKTFSLLNILWIGISNSPPLCLGLNLGYKFGARALEPARNCGLHLGDLGIKGLFGGVVPCALTHMCMLGVP